MIDASYFRKQLSRDVAAAGEPAVLEIRLLNGQFHRVHNVLAVEDGYVSLAVYEQRGKEIQWRENWQEQVFDGKTASDVSRAVVPYESILDVVVLAGRPVSGQSRIGFGTR